MFKKEAWSQFFIMHLVRRWEENLSNTMHELFIVTYQGGPLLPRNVIDGLQPLECNKYQVEFDPGRRELVSTCEKIKVLHKITINLH